MKGNDQILIVLIGPTGIGKTNTSIELAKIWDTEIISCDSRQMYREMKIGTAVPSATQLQAVKHHFIGNLSIHDYYNVYRYEVEVLQLLKSIYLKRIFRSGKSTTTFGRRRQTSLQNTICAASALSRMR